MSRRLIALNVALLALAGWLGWLIRANWLEAERRQQEMLTRRRASQNSAPVTAAKSAAQPVGAPANAASYFDVAARTLFAKDRNPDVVVEAPAPPPPPPPPPPTPFFYGVMDIGEGPTAFMAPRGGAQKAFKVGEQVGQYKLAALKEDSLVLEWEGKTFEKKFDELKDRSGGATQAKNEDPPPASNVPPPPKPREVRSDAAPGEDVGGEMRACNAADTSPAGTVSGNYRKVIRGGPFGNRCYWEPVR